MEILLSIICIGAGIFLIKKIANTIYESATKDDLKKNIIKSFFIMFIIFAVAITLGTQSISAGIFGGAAISIFFILVIVLLFTHRRQ